MEVGAEFVLSHLLRQVLVTNAVKGLCQCKCNDTKLGGKIEKPEGRAAIRGALAGWRDRLTETLGSFSKGTLQTPAHGLE